MGHMTLTDHHETKSAQDWHNFVPPTPSSKALQLLSLLGLLLGQLLHVLSFQLLLAFFVLLPLVSSVVPHLIIIAPLPVIILGLLLLSSLQLLILVSFVAQQLYYCFPCLP